MTTPIVIHPRNEVRLSLALLLRMAIIRMLERRRRKAEPEQLGMFEDEA